MKKRSTKTGFKKKNNLFYFLFEKFYGAFGWVSTNNMNGYILVFNVHGQL